MQLLALQLAQGRDLEGVPRASALAPALALCHLSGDTWQWRVDMKGGTLLSSPSQTNVPMSQCHPNGTSDTQAGSSGLSRPASPLGKLNHPQRAPPATKTHLQPFGCAQPCPIPAPHCHFGAQEWACPLQRLLVAQGSLGTWDSSAWQCPSTRSGGFPVSMWEVITAQSLQVHKNI